MSASKLSQLNSQKYRLLPDHTADELAALTESIKLAGILQAIIVDTECNIIDGFARYDIAIKLKLKHIPTKVINTFADEEAKRHFIYILNCNRRHLTNKQKEQLVIGELERDKRQADRVLGRLIGLSHPTVARIRRDLGAKFAVDVRQGVRNDEPYNYTCAHGSSTQVHRMAKDLVNAGEELRKQVEHDKNKLGVATAKAMRKVWETPTDYPAPKHYCCDFRKLPEMAGIKPNSIKLIITDPEYFKEKLWQYAELSTFAAKYLQEGGFLVCFMPNIYVPEAATGMCKSLEWVTSAPVIYGKGLPYGMQKARIGSHPGSKVAHCHVMVGVASKGKGKFPRLLQDIFHSPGNPLEHYKWEKPVEEMAYFIEKLTNPGELVVDPMFGSGTAAIACHQLGRAFIGGDISSKACNVFKNRCKELGMKSVMSA